MTPQEQKEIKKLLLSEISKTSEKILEYKEMTQPIAPENAIGRISRMDAINNKSINEAALLKAENKLKNLELAIEKMKDADFGICLKCSDKIPIQRIMLVPQSRFCVKCAS